MEFIASSLLSVNIFFVKALRQCRQIREAMKRWNVNYGNKLKQWSDEAFNAGKETEAMKRLTLHRIASSLLVPSFAPRQVFTKAMHRIRILWMRIQPKILIRTAAGTGYNLLRIHATMLLKI
jgi:hypothetical protein